MTKQQPTPIVSHEDIERIIRRNFPSNSLKSVIKILEEYKGTGEKEECYRVWAAILKLAEGHVGKLRMEIQSANFDYRDVIAAAEYPEYSQSGQRIHSLPEDEQEQIIASDWDQYQSWFHKGSRSTDRVAQKRKRAVPLPPGVGPIPIQAFAMGGCGCVGAFLFLGLFSLMMGRGFFFDLLGLIFLFVCGGVLGLVGLAFYKKGKEDTGGK